MATGYSVERVIAAPPERVWQLLADGPAYPEWNPAVLSFDGRIARGEKVRFVSMANPNRTFTVTVSELEPPHRMVWSSGMPLGLFRGVRTYTVQPDGEGSRFRMAESFSGALAPLIVKAIPDMTESFDRFADGLQEAAERREAGEVDQSGS